MNNTKAAVETLKRALRMSGYTYADVARHLGLSEASVKKMFSTCHFTLDRIDRICELLHMDFIDLVRLFDEQRQRISHLTVEQEDELVKDKHLLLVATCARNHYSFDDILQSFRFTRAELYRHLARLESLKLLELHPYNRIRLLVAEDFRWLPHGPIEKFFERHMLDDFINADFDQEREIRFYRQGPLTEHAREMLIKRINALVYEFSMLLRESHEQPVSGKKNIGLMLATRQWEPAYMAQQRRTQEGNGGQVE
ncbi:MAG: helix-turn-helix transcriptional regulator [Mariprofundaceae bacterium]|nr:helix-turn-helix transcriptional regulator [Mariprofundaceae bacterium]